MYFKFQKFLFNNHTLRIIQKITKNKKMPKIIKKYIQQIDQVSE